MYLFTSEVVSPGHPDKCADIIADSVVDATLALDRNARIASEVFFAGNHIIIGGEIKSKKTLNFEQYECLVKNTLEKILH